MEKSYLQQVAEASRFDADARFQQAIREKSCTTTAPAPVPHLGNRHDPQHPDADWAGNVPANARRRRHFQSHPSATQSTTQTENGIVPQAVDKSQPSRKHFASDIRFQGKGPAAQAAPLGTNVYQFGPGGQHDTSQWTTSYQAQAMQQPTNIEQKKQSMHPGTGKRQIKPSFEYDSRTGTFGAGARDALADRYSAGGQPLSTIQNLPGSGMSSQAPDTAASMSGSKAMGSRSMLQGMGSALVKSVRAPDTHVSVVTTIGNRSTNRHDKSLLMENYHKSVVGYTGRR